MGKKATPTSWNKKHKGVSIYLEPNRIIEVSLAEKWNTSKTNTKYYLNIREYNQYKEFKSEVSIPLSEWQEVLKQIKVVSNVVDYLKSGVPQGEGINAEMVHG